MLLSPRIPSRVQQCMVCTDNEPTTHRLRVDRTTGLLFNAIVVQYRFRTRTYSTAREQ